MLRIKEITGVGGEECCGALSLEPGSAEGWMLMDDWKNL